MTNYGSLNRANRSKPYANLRSVILHKDAIQILRMEVSVRLMQVNVRRRSNGLVTNNDALNVGDSAAISFVAGSGASPQGGSNSISAIRSSEYLRTSRE